MNNMNPKIDTYLIEGCGRCPLGNTPQCKVNSWREELETLRQIVLECGLKEELKWGVPCYTYENKNIVIVSAFKEYSSLSFFKGSLLKDPHNILVKPGENSQASRLIKFTNAKQIIQQKKEIKSLLNEAIAIEKSGAKVAFKKNPEPIPAELLKKFKSNPSLKKAFDALTPGRQRGYIIYFSGAKQSQTRESRIEKCTNRILQGKGFHD
jgi:uncharacterized protein YdeI (YjbR/CyaY-like superfamily)